MFMRRPATPVLPESGGERRSACRYPTSSGKVVVGWWQGDVFATERIALREISLTGASSLTNIPLPKEGPVWLRVEDPACPGWVEATVVEIVPHRRIPSLVRMRFKEPCPYEFLKVAIRGVVSPEEEEPQSTAGTSFWSGIYWR